MREVGSFLNEMAADHYRLTALHLDALRVRLGRDGLDMNEWNALVSAAGFLAGQANLRAEEKS